MRHSIITCDVCEKEIGEPVTVPLLPEGRGFTTMVPGGFLAVNVNQVCFDVCVECARKHPLAHLVNASRQRHEARAKTKNQSPAQ